MVWLGVLLWSAVALAQDYPRLDHKLLHSQQVPFRYYVDDRQARPADISLDEVERVVQLAWASWDELDCTTPAFEYAGRSTAAAIPNPGDRRDRYNVSAIWITSASDERYTSVLELGDREMAAFPLEYGGYLYQCDIFINAVDFKWSTATPTPPGFLDLQSYLMREVGHCLGLGTVYETQTAVMSSSAAPAGQNRRFITPHDEAHVCKHYPAPGQEGGPCAAKDTCAVGLYCAKGAGSKWAPAYSVCTRGCNPNTPGTCPTPLVCKPSTVVPDSANACLPAMADYTTRVGSTCQQDDPDCGSAWGLCLQPATLPSGQTAWTGGYCSEDCTARVDICPTGSMCAVAGSARLCFKTCDPNATSCRPGYVCSPRPEGNLCIPACYSDADCGSGYTCRLCDRACLPLKQPGRTVGDPCTQDAECGTGQVCLHVNGNPQGVCSQACGGQNTCSCPENSTCQLVGGAQMCVRTCSAGTCGASLSCMPFPLANPPASGCLPPCRVQGDCPSGTVCGVDSQCRDPYAQPDAGSCPLCPQDGGSDGGTLPPDGGGTVSDGGTGGGSGGGVGCGCQGMPSMAPGVLGGLMLLLVAGRRRRWQRP
jgi:uncharacterized protein (TIGR03382 family)